MKRTYAADDVEMLLESIVTLGTLVWQRESSTILGHYTRLENLYLPSDQALEVINVRVPPLQSGGTTP